MRAKPIALLFAIVLVCGKLSLGQSHTIHSKTTTYATLRFTSKDGDNCEAVVRDATGVSETRRFTISCNSKVIFTYSTPDHLLDISRDSFDGDRFFTRWEGTTLVHLVIFHIEINQMTSRAVVVFDQSAEFMSDVPSPDTLLVYKDKRFVGNDIMPTETDVFIWDGDTYELKSRWKWNEDMQYDDRFCVLDTRRLSCPVTPLPLK